jgi:enolase
LSRAPGRRAAARPPLVGAPDKLGNLDVQDYMALPLSATTWSEAPSTCVDIHAALGEVLTDHGYSMLRGR